MKREILLSLALLSIVLAACASISILNINNPSKSVLSLFSSASNSSNTSIIFFKGNVGELANATVMNDLLNTYSQFVSVGEEISNYSVGEITSNGQTIYFLNMSPYYVPIPYKISGNYPKLEFGGKPTFVYIGAQGCPFCALQRVAIILALARFGNFSRLYLDRSTTIDGDIPTYTFNFSQALFNKFVVNAPVINYDGAKYPYGDIYSTPFFTGAYYTSKYINLFPMDEVGGSFLINVTGISQINNTIYQDVLVDSGAVVNGQLSGKPIFGINGLVFGGVPFFDINNQFVFDGDIVPIQYIESEALNGSRMELLQSIQNPSSSPYGFLELAAANVLAAEICYTINNAAPICNLPYMQRLENKIINAFSVSPVSLKLPVTLVLEIAGIVIGIAVVAFIIFILYSRYSSLRKEIEMLKQNTSINKEHKEETQENTKENKEGENKENKS